jgi:hypothetical protein
MFSRRNLFLLAAAVALVTLAVAGTLAITSVSNHKIAVPSDARLYLYDTDILLAEEGRTWAWNSDVNASLSEADAYAPFMCPAGSTNSASFIAPSGGERTIGSWAVWDFIGFNDDGVLVIPPVRPDGMSSGSGIAIRESGGTYSFGIACTSNNNLTVTAAFYRTMHIEPGGSWKVDSLD